MDDLPMNYLRWWKADEDAVLREEFAAGGDYAKRAAGRLQRHEQGCIKRAVKIGLTPSYCSPVRPPGQRLPKEKKS